MVLGGRDAGDLVWGSGAGTFGEREASCHGASTAGSRGNMAASQSLRPRLRAGSASPPQRLLMRSVASYVARTLGEFGLEFSAGAVTGAAAGPAGRNETPAVLDAFSAFRDEVRRLAKEGAGAAQLLTACDRCAAS